MKPRSAAAERRNRQPLEYNVLLTATLCLLAFGAVMVYSASSARTLLEGTGDGSGYLVKYVGYGAVGVVLMHLVSRRRLDAVLRWTGCCASPGRCWPSRSRCWSRSGCPAWA